MEPLSILTRFRLCFLVFVWVVYATACVACSKGTTANGHVLCSGGPFSDPDAAFDWGDFRPTVLTTVASLLLAFYSNVCINLYQQAYLSAQDLRRSVFDVVTLAVGALGRGQRSQAVLNDIWRCANLIHASAYVLSDKARKVYSFESFMLPVGRAYGPWDGSEQLGMFRQGIVREASIRQHAPLPLAAAAAAAIVPSSIAAAAAVVIPVASHLLLLVAFVLVPVLSPDVTRSVSTRDAPSGELEHLMKASMWKRHVSFTTHLHHRSMANLEITSSRFEPLSERSLDADAAESEPTPSPTSDVERPAWTRAFWRRWCGWLQGQGCALAGDVPAAWPAQ